jgi:uncharacterized spore protein YtfJ
MKVEELMDQARDTITVKRVFGDPIERDGITIIPVARVTGGAGGGEGFGPTAAGQPSEGAQMAGGSGSGFGVHAVPAGAYVIRDGAVRWEPAFDLNRAVLLGSCVAFVALLVLRSILRSRPAPSA